MKLTNELGLPEALADAVDLGRHNREGELSATTLNKGVREIVLSMRHWDEMTVDVSECVWKLFGKAVHCILEENSDDNFHEEKFSLKVSEHTVTGTVDSYDMKSEVLYDWKTASIWKIRMGDFSDWRKQGLTYAWLMRENGLTVRKVRFVAFLKDWSASSARRDAEYPRKPVFVYEFDITEPDLEETGRRIENCVRRVEDALSMKDEDIPVCSPEERWAVPDKWAVVRKGAKRASRLFDTEKEAMAFAGEDKSMTVEFRKGASRKCEDYCLCRDFCGMRGGEK